jgi:hypothetical protein
MMELLAISRRELPRVVEHLETAVDGTWVRTKVGAVHRDPNSGKMFLQTLLAEGAAQDALRHHLQAAANRGAAPVVVIVESGETLGSVLRAALELTDDNVRCTVKEYSKWVERPWGFQISGLGFRQASRLRRLISGVIS